MLTLILMRHAKSSWTDPELSDHARSLNGRGRASATALGDWLKGSGHLPDTALVSTAQRTRETFERLKLPCSATFTPQLYLASASEMMRVLQNARGQNVLMIGHNPGIAQFAGELAHTLPSHPRFYDYPTCATWVAQINIKSWSALEWRSAQTVDFTIPRELLGDTLPQNNRKIL
jgi:phosphohistidine phosphatase